MTSAARLVFGLFAIASTSGGVSAQTCSTFDVASIKLNTSGAGGGYPELTPGGRRFTATNQLMVELIMSAYDVPPLQISGIPSVFSQDRYDVDATCEKPITKEQLPHLLQLLLAERFHLSIHRELREQTVYALVPAKAGPRLHETSQEGGKPTLKAVPVHFGGKLDLILLKSVWHVSMYRDGGNRPQTLLRGLPPLTLTHTTWKYLSPTLSCDLYSLG